MSKEREMIEIINSYMPKDPQQLNSLYESDAEICDFKGARLAYSMDEFSAADLLREEEPYTLGWNMAVGCISDILAVGANPRYYAHSLVINQAWTKEYVKELARGISHVLQESDAFFIGGDFGVSEMWRYTGSVIGELSGSPLLRSGAQKGDEIYITGKVGLGNLEAALQLYSTNKAVKKITGRFPNRFRLRNKEALLIKDFSSCCIDTSDGMFNALRAVSEMSKTGFAVGDLPYEKNGILLAKFLNIPREVLFLGECGEYELLFTIRKDGAAEFVKQAQARNLEFSRIGEIKEEGCSLLLVGNREIDLGTYNLSARDYEDTKKYLKDMVDFLELRRT